MLIRSGGGVRAPRLRKRNKMCRARATARVAPTGAWQEVRRVLCLRGRRRGHHCSTKAARAGVSGQRMAAQRQCESKTVNLKGWFAGQVGVHAGRTPGAEGFQNLGFDGVLWVLSAAVGRKCPAVGMTRSAVRGVLRMSLFRRTKFPRCLTADAPNFDRVHWLRPTVVPADWRPLSWPPIGALPRNRLAYSAAGSASAISPLHPPPAALGSLPTGAERPRNDRLFGKGCGEAGRPGGRPLRCMAGKRDAQGITDCHSQCAH